MPSMRRLKRHLLRWHRYAVKVNHHLGSPHKQHPDGYDRAWGAVRLAEWERDDRRGSSS